MVISIKRERAETDLRWARESRVSVNAGSLISLIARLWIASKVLNECLEAPLHKCEHYSRQGRIWVLFNVRSWVGMKKRLVRKRKPSLHAASFPTEIIWSFQERSEPKVTPNIDILSRNSNELESKEMSVRFLSRRLEIRQHCVLPALKLTKLWDPQFLSLLKTKFIEEAMFVLLLSKDCALWRVLSSV